MTTTTNYLANILGDDDEALLALREIPSFRNCSVQLQRLLFRYGKVVLLQEGEDLTREGEFDQWVFFVIKGRLAVFVGNEHVDTIASSLVGERCILGETRKATLSATEEGVTAIAVDMSLLDALPPLEELSPGDTAVYVELLSIVTAEVVNRIAELEFNLVDFANKYRRHQDTERYTEVLNQFRGNGYRGDRGTNFAIYKHLLRVDPVALERAQEPDGYSVHTGRLYAHALLGGNHELLYGTAEAVLAHLDKEGRLPEVAHAASDGEHYSFAEFAARMARQILQQHAEHVRRDPAAPTIAAAEVRRKLLLDDDLKVNLAALCAWLANRYAFSQADLMRMLMTLLAEASNYTARINARIKAMVAALTHTTFARELDAAMDAKDWNVDDYYHNTPTEELIPFFSRNIVEVYLVQPYVQRLHELSGGADAAEAASQSAGSDLVDSLFD